MERFVQLAVSGYEMVHPEWIPLFTTGSSPASWEGDIPSNEELRTALKEQSKRVIGVLEGKLDAAIPKTINIGSHAMDTVEAVVQFAIWHEGVHAGMIDGLNKSTVQ